MTERSRNIQKANGLAPCQGCDGDGIMILVPGLHGEPSMEAPCIVCSPDKNLFDLVRDRDTQIRHAGLERERKAIQAHNERLAGKAD